MGKIILKTFETGKITKERQKFKDANRIYLSADPLVVKKFQKSLPDQPVKISSGGLKQPEHVPSEQLVYQCQREGDQEVFEEGHPGFRVTQEK